MFVLNNFRVAVIIQEMKFLPPDECHLAGLAASRTKLTTVCKWSGQSRNGPSGVFLPRESGDPFVPFPLLPRASRDRAQPHRCSAGNRFLPFDQNAKRQLEYAMHFQTIAISQSRAPSVTVSATKGRDYLPVSGTGVANAGQKANGIEEGLQTP